MAPLVFQDGCVWSCTGTVAERQQSSARQAILDLLRDHDSLTPAEIARELEKPNNTIRMLLSRMAEDRLIVKQGYGKYARKESAEDCDELVQEDFEPEDASWKGSDSEEDAHAPAVLELEDQDSEE